MEKVFAKIGYYCAYHPWKLIVLSVIIMGGFGAGFGMLENETRPEKQWVADGSPSLDHNAYVSENWPSKLRRNVFVAKCREEGCNVFETKYLQRMQELHEKILNVEVDGDKIYQEYEDKKKAGEDSPWEIYKGTWTFRGNETAGHKAKCFKIGDECWMDNILEVFHEDSNTMKHMTDSNALNAINFWEGQKSICSVSIGTPESPCINATRWDSGAAEDACQTYDWAKENSGQPGCKTAIGQYCASVCVDNNTNSESCKDGECVGTPDLMWPFVPPPAKISQFASSGKDGPTKDSNGKYVSAEVMFGTYSLEFDEIVVSGSTTDPVGDDWEKQVLCILGINVDPRNTDAGCDADDLLEFTGQFQRSFGDEFGNAIRGDIGALGSSYMVILVYLIIMLSKRDPVHSMIGMSVVTVIIVGASFVCAMGLGAYFGLPNNNLNNNIPFLLLGLGVDDAFVLAGEFSRQIKLNPKISNEQAIINCCASGGISILITSVTDALAFLVGSATVLPALGWFCKFAGFGVIFCFIFQLTFFLPALMINARRASAQRYDCCCCCKAKMEHDFNKPNGCCNCKCTRFGDKLGPLMGKFGKAITSRVGKVLTILIFAGITAAGALGITKIYKDFKLEWFIPDDSYVNVYFQDNEKYFGAGTPFSIYMGKVDYFKNMDNMQELTEKINKTKYVDQDASITNWWEGFRDYNTTTFASADELYDGICGFTRTNQGIRFRSSIQWVDADCADEDDGCRVDSCDTSEGINNTRISALLDEEYLTTGTARYDTLLAVRKMVDDIFEDPDKVYPFSFQFLYWEEVGVIDTELTRNLIVCAAVILVIVMLLIPNPRVSIWVVLCIMLSLVDVVGYLYWWDVTISSISTIYILICVGLAVDYSAHIAHMFNVSTGTGEERTIKALERIGPSVFNAVVSTFLAVVVISTSKSYVFRIFFKCLFLVVVLGGAHGLWLMPVLLSMFGGTNKDDSASNPDEMISMTPKAVVVEEGTNSTSTKDNSIHPGDDIETKQI